jgi:hypothetical protein
LERTLLNTSIVFTSYSIADRLFGVIKYLLNYKMLNEIHFGLRQVVLDFV